MSAAILACVAIKSRLTHPGKMNYTCLPLTTQQGEHMKQQYGWWMPDRETHFPEHFKKQRHKETPAPYQRRQRNWALGFVDEWRHCLDVGGNIGTWSRELCVRFDRVTAWEPQEDARDCYVKNVPHSNYTLHPQGLGEHAGVMKFYQHDVSCGNASLRKEGVLEGPSKDKPTDENLVEQEIEVVTLDSYRYTDVDFVKIDVQGYEWEVLKGATALLTACQPTLCLELPTRTDKERILKHLITDWLKQFNYRLEGNMNKETVYTAR